MVLAGRFRHFRGSEYRALFTVPYALTTLPSAEQTLIVVAFSHHNYLGLRVTDKIHEHDLSIVKVRWVGERPPTLDAPEIVIYCNLDGVYARTAIEFEEIVDSPEWGRGARFERIGA